MEVLAVGIFALLIVGVLVVVFFALVFWLASIPVAWGIRRALRDDEVADRLTAILREALRPTSEDQ